MTQVEYAVTNAVMAESDRACIAAGTPSKTLMMRAAEAIADRCGTAGKIYVFCGKGNNGGDGYAAALILARKGADVTAFALSDKTSDDAAYYRDALRNEFPSAVRPIGECDYDFDIAVDCIFGTGFSGEPRGLYADVIDRLNAARGKVIAADIASGLDGTSGIAVKAVRADATVAVQSAKTGHFLGDGKDFSGALCVADIGIPIIGERVKVWNAADVAALFPPRKNNTNKGSYGKCALVGGCRKFVGAAKLAAMGATALRSGAGLCVLCVPDCIADAVAADITECTLAPLPDSEGALAYDSAALDAAVKGCNTIAVGMGMGGNTEVNRKILADVFARDAKVIVDADGLNALAADASLLDGAAADILLTPHPGEFGRLTGLGAKEVLADPMGTAKRFAAEHGCKVLLKGASTYVTDGTSGALVVNGSAAQSKGGSGDTLTGAIAGIAAQGAELTDAACAATYLCAEAAKLAAERWGEQGVLASDVARAIVRAKDEAKRQR